MADAKNGPATGSAAGTGGAATVPTVAPPSKPNPALRMMGLPNFRFKLPSRNWLIFWGIVGSWTAALVYDRQEKKKIQQKWCKLVSHLAQETLPLKELPRKVTVVLSAPPADGLMSAREHFHDYVKPVLVASGLDWDVVEGRKEGDVRAGVAVRIRRLRRRREGIVEEAPEGKEDEEAVWSYRERQGIYPAEGVAGDIIIGRNTWKEYIRGLHEGWLGPLEPLRETQLEQEPAATLSMSQPESTSSESLSTTNSSNEAIPQADASSEPVEKPTDEEKQEVKKKKQPQPLISTSAYPSASPPSYIPSELGPSAVVPFPHILGFLNTPIRMKRFLTRRYLADDIGRQVAAVALAAYRPFDQTSSQSGFTDDNSPTSFTTAGSSMAWEQRDILQHEEREWHKSIRKDREVGKESVWLDEPVFDERIAGRMRHFALDAEQESRAQRIRQGKEDAIDKYKSGDLDQN